MRTLLLIATTVTLYPLFAKTITYKPAAEVKPSEWFTCKVNGQNNFVYDSEIAPFTYFDTNEETVIEIVSKREIKWLEIKPKSLGLSYTFSGYNIKVKVNKPCQFAIEINGMPYKEPLLVFVNPLETYKPSKTDTNVIYFEEGKIYKQGKIELKSGKTLYIEGGAVVEGFIKAENATDIKVIGRGILDGYNNINYNNGKWHHFLQFKDCNRVTVSGFNIVRARTWELVTLHTKNITIDNIHIISEHGGDDGIDVVRTQNLHIKNSFIRSKDDNIVVKCTWPYPDSARTQNVLVENCVLWNTIWGNAIEIGFELQTDTVKNIRFRNCDVIHCEAGSVFSIHNTDYAVVKDIVFENIRVEEANQKLFDLSIFLSKYSKDNSFSKEETANRYWHGVWDNAIKLTDEENLLKIKPSDLILANQE